MDLLARVRDNSRSLPRPLLDELILKFDTMAELEQVAQQYKGLVINELRILAKRGDDQLQRDLRPAFDAVRRLLEIEKSADFREPESGHLVNVIVGTLRGLLEPRGGDPMPPGFLWQWASEVIDFSSQFSDPDWAAHQAVGEPNTFEYGDIATAWAPGPQNGTIEQITLGFDTPVFANGVTIRETWGNGFVRAIEVLDLDGVYSLVWEGTDPSQPGTPVDFEAGFSPPTSWCGVSASLWTRTMTPTPGRRSTRSSSTASLIQLAGPRAWAEFRRSRNPRS